MRIVAGELRGRVLSAPRGDATRPTSDRVREAVFSTLESRFRRLEGARVLDLFAGSGALGIEALSRGAAHATFIEDARPALSVLSDNIRSLGLSERSTVLSGDAFRLASRLLSTGPFSLLFLDPPYRIEPARVRELLEDLACAGSLERDAVIVYEHRTGAVIEWPPDAEDAGQRRYGETTVSYAVRHAEEGPSR